VIFKFGVNLSIPVRTAKSSILSTLYMGQRQRRGHEKQQQGNKQDRNKQKFSNW